MTMRNSPFFEDVKQTEIMVGGQVGRVPIFYYEGSSMTAVFPARLGALRRLLPDRRFEPARLAPGVGVVSVTCFEYLDTDIDPYNELAIAIPLNEPHFRPNPPGRALVELLTSGQAHAFVRHLPVTTEVARAGGVDFYNYPKFVASIDFTETGSRRSCRLAEGAEHILTVTAAKPAANRESTIQVFSHLWMDAQPQSSEFKIHSNKTGMSFKPGAATIELGTRHPIALELDRLLLSRKSINFQWMADFEGILYGPEHMTLPLLQRAMVASAEAADHTA